MNTKQHTRHDLPQLLLDKHTACTHCIMSIFDKFPFLKGLPENEYDSAFRENVPDMAALLSYDVFVEFTHAEFPETMPYMRSLQDELREMKRRGYRDTEFPGGEYYKRLNKLFPLGENKELFNLFRTYVYTYKKYSDDADLKELLPEVDDLMSGDTERCSYCRRNNRLYCMRKRIPISAIDYDNDSVDDDDYDDVWPYDYKYCMIDDMECTSNKCFDYLYEKFKEHNTDFAFEVVVYSLLQSSEYFHTMSIENLVQTFILFYRAGYDTTSLLENIYKHNPNLAIRLTLYPDPEIKLNREMEYSGKLFSWYAFVRSSAEDMASLSYELSCYLLTRENKKPVVPKYIKLMNFTEKYILSKHIIDDDEIKDNESLKRTLPDLATFKKRANTASLKSMTDIPRFNITYAESVKFENAIYTKIIAKIFPHMVDLSIEYFFERYGGTLCENIRWALRSKVDRLDFSYRLVPEMLERLDFFYNNGTMKNPKCHSEVPESVIKEAETCLPVYNYTNYGTISHIVSKIVGESMSVPMLFQCMPYADEDTLNRIYELILKKDKVRAFELYRYRNVTGYQIASLMNFVRDNFSKNGKRYKEIEELFRNYHTMSRTYDVIIDDLDASILRKARSVKKQFVVPSFFKKTYEYMNSPKP